MSDAAQSNERITRFYDDFLLPLMCGGTAIVTSPITASDVERMTLADFATRETLTPIYDAITNDAAMRGVEAAPRRLAKGPLATAAALFNLALYSDPLFSESRFEVRRQKLLDEAVAFLRVYSPIDERIDAIVTHMLVTRFADLQRTETDYHFWLGSRRFVGRPVPPQLLRLRTLRRVRTESQRTRILDVLPIAATSLWALIVDRSPITSLTTPALAPNLRVTDDALRTLGDTQLSRYVRAELERLPDAARRTRIAAISHASHAVPEPFRERVTSFAEGTLSLLQGTP